MSGGRKDVGMTMTCNRCDTKGVFIYNYSTEHVRTCANFGGKPRSKLQNNSGFVIGVGGGGWGVGGWGGGWNGREREEYRRFISIRPLPLVKGCMWTTTSQYVLLFSI